MGPTARRLVLTWKFPDELSSRPAARKARGFPVRRARGRRLFGLGEESLRRTGPRARRRGAAARVWAGSGALLPPHLRQPPRVAPFPLPIPRTALSPPSHPADRVVPRSPSHEPCRSPHFPSRGPRPPIPRPVPPPRFHPPPPAAATRLSPPAGRRRPHRQRWARETPTSRGARCPRTPSSCRRAARSTRRSTPTRRSTSPSSPRSAPRDGR